MPSIGLCRDTDSEPIISQPADERKENLEPASTPLLSRPNSKGIRQTVSAPKMPNYAKMPLLDLKKIASEFGLRVNTSRRLIEHQLKAIWEQTCGGGSSNSSAIEIEQQQQATPNQQVGETLVRQLREHIRGQPGLFEQILCYQVLQFDSVYQDILRSVPCQKWMLRKFFDSEGIVYTSFEK
ncbi:hypothetical protein LPJ66_010025 [Kickxella alabastrina]|uniref:Uncharacterized protein n=1 Tax=Kickxella alabastrina TaxID=61397 RepID=A0ACC1I1L5_9FUNG|nr:hypothetical protein LPJ66_010025 [Kickxella alabastrina]